MSGKDDEKYAKVAAKQTERQRLIVRSFVAGSFLMLFLVYIRSMDSSKSSSSSSSSSHQSFKSMKTRVMADGDDVTHEMLRKEDVMLNDVRDKAATESTETTSTVLTLEQLDKTVADLDAKVREIKKRVDIFETNSEAQTAAKQLQAATRQVLHRRFGPDYYDNNNNNNNNAHHHPYRVVVELEFQPTIVDFAQHGSSGSFTIALAPSSLQPHSIHTFLEIARQWHGGAFHRIAGHVLQVMVQTHTIQHLAFQEYSPAYPHKRRTVGYAGRPSGPAWYVSIQDNSKNHGPGSQQDHNPYEADSCFGTIVEGYEEHVLRITKVDGHEFIGDAKKHVLIKSMTIHVPTKDGSYVVWREDTAVY